MQHKEKEKLKIILDALSKVVIEERIILDKSQRLLAFEYGLHKSLINRIENCVSEPKLSSFIKVAEVLQMKPDELFIKLYKYLPDDFRILD